MLSRRMASGTEVLSAMPGMKSYEIPPPMRSTAGMLGEHTPHVAKSSVGCGCGGGCGPCGGAKASLMSGASGVGGAGAVMQAPAALRSFEMLPQGMNAGAASAAGGMRGYEIPPNAKLASQGLTRGMRALRAYEMMPGAREAQRGLERQGNITTGCGHSQNGGSAAIISDTPYVDPTARMAPSGFPAPVYGSLGDPPPTGGARASDCESLLDEIERLRLRRRMLLEEIGSPDLTRPVEEAWAAARRACAATDRASLCQALWDAFQSSPVRGEGVHLRNALWELWSQCSLGEGSFLSARWFVCWAAITHAQEVERDAATRMRRTPPIDYQRDIAPLDDEITRLELMYQRCIRSVQGMVPSVRPPGSRACGEECAGFGCRLCCAFQCPDNYSECTSAHCSPRG